MRNGEKNLLAVLLTALFVCGLALGLAFAFPGEPGASAASRAEESGPVARCATVIGASVGL